MSFRDSLMSLRDERLDLSYGHFEQLEVAVGHFERANGGPVPVSELTADHVRRMMRALMAAGKSARTVNNYARSILRIWEGTREAPLCPRKDVRLLVEPERYPTAWRQDQLDTLVRACGRAPVQRGWGPDHWRALILTVYDTSLRIGCLLKLPASALCMSEMSLLVPGEFQKGRADTYQRLHPDTAERLARIERPNKMLIPWPYAKEELWRRLESLILAPAGLPHGRHKQDLSKFYLDRTMIDTNPLDALPRPM